MTRRSPSISEWSALPRLVLCAGMKSSGSTWLFNVVAEILRSGRPGSAATGRRARRAPKVLQCYADDPAMFPRLSEPADYLVVKSHAPSSLLRTIVNVTHSPVFLTLREPRDAIASLMRRFDHPFEVAFTEIDASARQIVELVRDQPSMILRFESRFYDRVTTVRKIAAVLQLKQSAKHTHAIFGALTRGKVIEKIARLQRMGCYGLHADPDRYDPTTHWHPGHVGDLVIGKYAHLLSVPQQDAVLLATMDYRRQFKYAAEGASPRSWSRLVVRSRRYVLGDTIVFCKGTDAYRFLTEGWSAPEANFTWGTGEKSCIELWITKLPSDAASFRLALIIQPFKAKAVRRQRFDVSVNDVLLWQGSVVGRETLNIAVPRNVLERQNPVVVTLHHPNGVKPSEIAANSKDSRCLSIAVTSLRLTATSKRKPSTNRGRPHANAARGLGSRPTA